MKGVLRIKHIIFSHRLLSIVLAVILTMVVLKVLASRPWFTEVATNSIIITEKNGIFDLTDIDNLDKTVINLLAGDVYYPNTYLTPESVNTVLPENIDNFERIRADYLSQRYVLKVPESSGIFAFTFTLSGRHAMKVYVNGKLAEMTGKTGTTKQDTEVWENNISFHGAAENGKIDIILCSAQFYHAKRGASLANLTLSKNEALSDPFFYSRIKGMVNMGALFCAAVLLLGIYLRLSRIKTTLYFALACVVMAMRECLQSQAWTYFPIPGNISFMLEYLSMVLLTIFLSLYLGQYLSGKFLRVVQHTAILGSLVYGVSVLFGDSMFYTTILKYYQFFLVSCIVPGIGIMFWKMRRPTAEQGTAIFGIAVFYFAAISDIVMYSDLFGDSKVNTPVSEAAMLVFVLAQTISLFQMNHRVLWEAKEAEQRLEAEKTALESLNRLKTEFLGNVSHELKTPLTVLSGYAQLIGAQLEGPEYSAARDKSRIISSEADRLALLVGQMLDMTRIEENNILLEKRYCHIDELIYQAVETHFPILNKSGNRLEIDAGLDLPMVNVDSGRITQVIVNLISNALKHTQQGVITISAEKVEDYIEVSISDTGEGISEEELNNLFTRFHQGNGKTGTGLGLYICKYLVEEHGGSIRVESTLNRGTKVTFSLPL